MDWTTTRWLVWESRLAGSVRRLAISDPRSPTYSQPAGGSSSSGGRPTAGRVPVRLFENEAGTAPPHPRRRENRNPNHSQPTHTASQASQASHFEKEDWLRAIGGTPEKPAPPAKRPSEKSAARK
jgi:hypothetical protein